MQYISSWFYGFFKSLRYLLFKSNVTYRNLELSKNNNKLDKKSIKQVIFALNNIPDKIHEHLFKIYDNVSKNYHQITYTKYRNTYEPSSSQLSHLSNDIRDASIRFIFIRINLIKNENLMNHVNCIIIDKKQKFILYFEPMAIIKIDINELVKIIINFSDDLNNYMLLTPDKIGYNFYNRLQRYDNYCQTYILYVYYLIIENDNVKYTEFSNMFNTIITSDSVKCFLYFVYNLLLSDGINIDHFEFDNLNDQSIDSIVINEENDWLIDN